MRFSLWVAASAVSAATASAAIAQDEPGLAPITPWTLDYGVDSCALSRTFGSAEDPVRLEFRRYSPGLMLETLIASKSMKARRSARVQYRFGQAGAWQDAVNADTVATDDGFSEVRLTSSLMPVVVTRGRRPPPPDAFGDTNVFLTEAERAALAGSITLRGAFREELTLRVGSLAKPIESLNACVDELMTHWNIDVEAHKTLSRQATPVNPARLSQMIDYPAQAIVGRVSGQVNVRLAIDDTGKVTGCHNQAPGSDPVFEEMLCAGFETVEFNPALDKDGKPIASYWTTTYRFRAR